MSNLTRGTTPTITITTDTDLTGYEVVYLTIEDKDGNEITADLSQMTVSKTGISVQLTQAQTIALNRGKVKLQVRARSGTTAIASEIMQTTLDDVLKDGVI